MCICLCAAALLCCKPMINCFHNIPPSVRIACMCARATCTQLPHIHKYHTCTHTQPPHMCAHSYYGVYMSVIVTKPSGAGVVCVLCKYMCEVSGQHHTLLTVAFHPLVCRCPGGRDILHSWCSHDLVVSYRVGFRPQCPEHCPQRCCGLSPTLLFPVNH